LQQKEVEGELMLATEEINLDDQQIHHVTEVLLEVPCKKS
jgi:hypothetical protein